MVCFITWVCNKITCIKQYIIMCVCVSVCVCVCVCRTSTK